MKLVKEEIQFIDQYLIKNDVKFWDVRTELLDHIILATEAKIKNKGISFNEALIEVHEEFGNKLGHFKSPSFEQRLYYSNKGFKKFTLEKQKEIGKKYRRQHWQGLKNLFLSPKFLLEYVLFGVAYYICFLNFTKLAIVFGMILLMLPTFYSGFHSIKNKMARRSLNIVLTTGISLLPWSIYNLTLQIFNMTYEGKEDKPYYILLILTILCYPLMRSGLNIYLKIYNDFKNQYHLMVNS
jgi:uncharacterized protein with PQ loop repeat